MNNSRDPEEHPVGFVHPDCRPGHRPQGFTYSDLGLALATATAFVTESDSVWGYAIGAVLLIAGGFVAWRFRAAFRSAHRRSREDNDPRKLYQSDHC